MEEARQRLNAYILSKTPGELRLMRLAIIVAFVAALQLSTVWS